MTSARMTVRFVLGLALLVAVAILITLTRGSGLQPTNNHDQRQLTNAAEPAGVNQAQAQTVVDGGNMGEKTTLTPGGSTNASTIGGGAAGGPGSGRPADIVTRAGPDDTGVGIGYSGQTQPQGCTQKPCMQVGR